MNARITNPEQITSGIANEHKIDPARISVSIRIDANIQTATARITGCDEDEATEIAGTIEDMGWSTYTIEPISEDLTEWEIIAEYDDSLDDIPANQEYLGLTKREWAEKIDKTVEDITREHEEGHLPIDGEKDSE